MCLAISKERAKEDKVFKNFIVKSLNKIENKNKNVDDGYSGTNENRP